MIEILKRTAEYQSWGMNAATISFFATMFFTALQGWALFKQNSTIRRNRSGQSLLTWFFVYSGCYFFSFAVYGITRSSIAMTFNGLLGIPYIFILISLHRFEGFKRVDRAALMMFSLMMPTAYFLKGNVQNLFIFAGLFGLVIPLIGQVLTMYREKAVGSVEPRFILAFIFSNIFWFVYGITNKNWIFIVFNPISFTVLVTALSLYYRYKAKAEG